MKRIGILLTIFTLSTLIIIGCGQFVIGKMMCPSGMNEYSIGNAKDCCEKKDNENKSLESSCCKLINISLSLNDFSFSQKIKIAAQQLDFFLPQFVSHNLESRSYSSENIFSIADLPPPDTKTLLFSFRSLLL